MVKKIEGKSVVAEKFIRALKNKIYKYMNAVSKNVYIDKLPESAKQYKSTIHRSIKLKSTDVKLDTFINFDVKFNIRKPNLMLVLM